jgi:hypothetical protein
VGLQGREPLGGVGSSRQWPRRWAQSNILIEQFSNYEIICGAETGGGELKTSLNTKGGGYNNIFIEPNERWRLDYEVTSANAHPVHFTLEIFVESNEVKVSKI